MADRQLVLNKVKCLCCNKELISFHVHDYKTCGCENETTVDGGLSYLRYGGVDISKVQSLPVYVDDDYELVRESFHWGTYGKDGNLELSFVKLSDMSNNHINKIIQYMFNTLPRWLQLVFTMEKAYRKAHKIRTRDKEYLYVR